MRVIKLALISIVALFFVMSIFSLMMPSTVIVSRAVDINAPLDSIKFHVSDLHQWVYWVKGMNSKSVTIQSSKEANLGRQQLSIQKITDSSVISYWTSPSANVQVSTIQFIPAPQRNLTIVQWQFVQQLHWYPWEKFGSFMNDKILGPMMEQNLQNLKLLSEHQTVNLEVNLIEAQ